MESEAFAGSSVSAVEADQPAALKWPPRTGVDASAAEARGLRVVIAGAGGAAHLPGMTAAMTLLPVIGVPVRSKALSGMDSLLSIAQMPAGVPVGTMAIGKAGAVNAALLSAAILAAQHPDIREALAEYRRTQTQTVLDNPLPGEPQ